METREIKFKCLTECDDDKVVLGFKKFRWSNYGLSGKSIFPEYKQISPDLQYTGLKDKNGVEIYEGDVLSDREHNYIVGWHKEMATFVLNRKGWAFSHFFKEGLNNETSEVIGNIYENP